MKTPNIKISILGTKPIGTPGWLQVQRSKIAFTYPDGSISQIIDIDHVFRTVGEDAVCMLAHYIDPKEQQRYVYLRSAIRPALHFHKTEPEQINRWELPAGLVDAGETLVQTAVRESKEELGFDILPKNFFDLGHRVFTVPSKSLERVFYYEVLVDPKTKKLPQEDGSPMEKFGEVKAVPLKQAITLVNEGIINGAITEIGLRRLIDKFGY